MSLAPLRQDMAAAIRKHGKRLSYTARAILDEVAAITEDNSEECSPCEIDKMIKKRFPFRPNRAAACVEELYIVHLQEIIAGEIQAKP